MNPFRAVCVGAFSIALLLISSFALSSPASAVANVPVHAVGDSVGFGVHTDLGAFAQPYLAQLRQLDASEPNITINDLTLTGSFDHWTVVKVTEVSADTYVISEEFATGLKLHFAINVTLATAPAEGQYTGTIDPVYHFCMFNPIPPVTKTVSARLDVTSLQTGSTTEKWNVSDFALRESTMAHAVDLTASFSSRNFPTFDVNLTACTQTVTYENHDYSITVDVNNQYRIAYAPALDVFDFPMSHGERWYVNTTATLAGTLSGSINLEGMDPAEGQAFFDQLNLILTQSGASVTGLDGFPIVLERITFTVGTVPYLSDGVLHDIPIPVNEHLRGKEMTKTLADGQFHTVFEISSVPPPNVAQFAYFACYYSPDDGFIVGCALLDASSGIALFELKNVPVTEAERGLGDTKAGYALVTQGNPLADFFFKPPFLGLVLIAATVIVVAALLARRIRARARQMPLTPETPPPPPGTS